MDKAYCPCVVWLIGASEHERVACRCGCENYYNLLAVGKKDIKFAVLCNLFPVHKT